MAHTGALSIPKAGIEYYIYHAFFRNGYYGVIIFFTISGYLITSKIIDGGLDFRNLSITNFYIKRVARIIPMLLLTLAILAMLDLVWDEKFGIHPPYSISEMIFWALTFQYNNYHLKYGSPILPWGVLWSLSIEEMFYLFYPQACKLMSSKARVSGLLILIILVSYISASNGASPNSLTACAGQLAVGCLTALYAKAKIARWMLKKLRATLIVAACAAVLYLNGVTDNTIWFPPILSVATGVLLVVAANTIETSEKPPFVNRVLAAIGQVSYEIYLIHGIFIISISQSWINSLSELTVLLFIALLLYTVYVVSFLLNTFYTAPIARVITTNLLARR
jgi:peptidoglycan/LPS O-acetylase OafA/YrhL